MSGLLSGLEKLGLKNLENMDLYAEPKKEERIVKKPEPEKKEPIVPQEKEFLFDKKYECPVCDQQFVQKTVRTGKMRLLKTDMDLRPVYEHIEPIKYEAIVCPWCGYAAHSRYFGAVTVTQRKNIREAISQMYKRSEPVSADFYTYEEAIEKYKLCLANAIVKKAKASEKAYICLKAGWLVRSMRENMDKAQKEISVTTVRAARQLTPEQLENRRVRLEAQENEFLQNAMTGFVNARQTEDFPICGMDSTTLEYLLAVLAMQNGNFELSSRMISGILASPSANSRIKDKVRDVKEALMNKMKEKGVS